MNLSQLEFGSLLSYCPKGTTPNALHAKGVMQALKRDQHIGQPPTTILMSNWMAKAVQQRMPQLPFAAFFQPDTILVPVPKSSLMQPNTLWIPERIAVAMVSIGSGKQVSSCLVRTKAVPKAASCSHHERPTAQQHYDSISVQGILEKPKEIVLVDDVVTRGATLLGCANRLADAFPECRIRAFAAMRTISNPEEFENVYSPCTGMIDLWETGETMRRP